MTTMRSHVSKLKLRIPLPDGPSLTAEGKIISVQAPKSTGRGDGSYRICTSDGVPVKQAYINPTTNKVVPAEDQRRFIEGNMKNGEDEVKKILTPAEYDKVKEAKKSVFPKNIVEITIHPGSANDELWPTSERNSYVFVPDETDPENIAMDAVIRSILNQRDDEGRQKYVLVSVANIKNSEGFYRLSLYRGHIVLESVVYTDALNPHEVIEVDVDPDLVAMADNVAGALVEDFDPSAYVDGRTARVKAVEAGTAGEATAEAVEEKRASVRDSIKSFLDKVNV